MRKCGSKGENVARPLSPKGSGGYLHMGSSYLTQRNELIQGLNNSRFVSSFDFIIHNLTSHFHSISFMFVKRSTNSVSLRR